MTRIRSARQVFARLNDDESGVAAIEFGLLGSFMIAVLLGVLQVGIAMQNYNALRGVSAELSRYAVVQYQAGNELTNSQLETYGSALATSSPYLLPNVGTSVAVTPAATQRVSGATELNLQVTTQVASVLGMIGINSFPISHTRPIFVIDE